MRRVTRHVPAIVAFAALTAFWIWPALRDLDRVLPGGGPGDNLTFVWNTWWMHQAVSTGRSPLWTSMLFAPWGTSLALNTHAAGPSLAGAALLPLAGSAMAATNLIVAIHLFLNFVVTYALAFRVTRSGAAAAVAAIVFGCSPYVGAHLQGHFNLVAAWVLPLAALVTLLVLERGSPGRLAGAGMAWGTLVYVDYYYAVFAAVMVAAMLAARALDVRLTRRDVSRFEWLTLAVIGALLAVDIAIIAVIAMTGGTVIRLAGRPISMQGLDNPTAVAGLLAAMAAAILLGRRVRVSMSREVVVADVRRVAVPLAIACILSAPILLAITKLWIEGDYVTQRYLWRSAPPGIDLATIVLGNPGGLVTGRFTGRAYERLGIDAVEQSGWLGPAVIILCAIAIGARRTLSQASHGSRTFLDPCNPCAPWLLLGGIFATWAIGPYLVAAGTRVWVLLPATIVRFVPLVSNARIPSRAMIVVSLAAAMLAAIGWRRLRDQNRGTLAFMLGLLLLADYFPARPPVFALDRPSVYDALAAQSAPGIVCELPLGLRDGFGEAGRLDTRVLAYQTRHGLSITGGFVARLSPRLVAAYESDPILGPLLRLSSGAPVGAEPQLDAQTTIARLRRHGIRYFVLNEETAPADLVTWVRTNLPLRMILRDGGRALYAVDAAIAGSRQSPSTVPSRP